MSTSRSSRFVFGWDTWRRSTASSWRSTSSSRSFERDDLQVRSRSRRTWRRESVIRRTVTGPVSLPVDCVSVLIKRPTVMWHPSRHLGGDELLPDRSAARSWSEQVAAKNLADRARGDADRKPAKLTLNADTTPAFVLPAESNDELDDLIAKWRTSRTSLGSPPFPLATRELPVPAEQSLGRDEKATPAPPWKYSAEHSEDRSVCGSVAHAAMELPLQHPDLVAKHHQLDVLVQSCPSAGSQCLKNAARDEIAEAEAHNR